MELAAKTKVGRVNCNMPHARANSGSWSGGQPFTDSLGCGTWAGNMICDNINYRHFLNYTWLSRPIEEHVPNAGILYPTRVLEIPREEWRRVMDVNVDGLFWLTQEVLRTMIPQKYGRIVNMSSSAGRSVSTLGGVHYTASKAAVLGITRAIAKEVAQYGITCNAVCPGLIDTAMVRKTVAAERIRSYEQSFPISRLGTPEEVADLVAFLSSDESAYVTGASIDINGGDLMI